MLLLPPKYNCRSHRNIPPRRVRTQTSSTWSILSTLTWLFQNHRACNRWRVVRKMTSSMNHKKCRQAGMPRSHAKYRYTGPLHMLYTSNKCIGIPFEGQLVHSCIRIGDYNAISIINYLDIYWHLLILLNYAQTVTL